MGYRESSQKLQEKISVSGEVDFGSPAIMCQPHEWLASPANIMLFPEVRGLGETRPTAAVRYTTERGIGSVLSSVHGLLKVADRLLWMKDVLGGPPLEGLTVSSGLNVNPPAKAIASGRRVPPDEGQASWFS